jgi:heme-degrading monooxygenase HmoA
VIARIWKARATPQGMREYAEYLQSAVVPELGVLAGYQGVTLLEHPRDGAVDVTVITWWTSLEAIRAFAGDALETAVVHDRAAQMLIDFDRRVEHHQVAFQS